MRCLPIAQRGVQVWKRWTKQPHPLTLRLLPEEKSARLPRRSPVVRSPWHGWDRAASDYASLVTPPCCSCSVAMLPVVSCHSNPPKHIPLPPSFVSAPSSLAVPALLPHTQNQLHNTQKPQHAPKGLLITLRKERGQNWKPTPKIHNTRSFHR